MSENEIVNKKNNNESYLLSCSPGTKSISYELNEAESGAFQIETARYIEGLCSDLVIMATRADMNFLAYLLDMARIEASDRIEKPDLEKSSNVA